MLAPFVNLFLRLGISPDAVTLVGTLGVSAGALVFFPQGMVWQGVLVITAFVFSDLIDGAMARKSGRKDDFGAFLDSTLDRIADGALFGGLALYFAWHHESRLYLVLCLVILVMGAVTSYARAKADHLGYDAKVGIAERPDRLVGMLVPAFFADVLDLLDPARGRALGAGDRGHRDGRPAHLGRTPPGTGPRGHPGLIPARLGARPDASSGVWPHYDRGMSEHTPETPIEHGTSRVKRGMAEMLKGGVIMDVVTAEQAKIAEDAGAVAVMALERVPADIRAQGGVSRMSDPDMIDSIIEAVSIPVMAKARIGHFAEAQILQSPGRRLHRRVRGPHPGRLRQPHRQVEVHRPVRVRCHQPRRGAATDHRGRGDDPLQGRGRHR